MSFTWAAGWAPRFGPSLACLSAVAVLRGERCRPSVPLLADAAPACLRFAGVREPEIKRSDSSYFTQDNKF